MTNSKYKLGRCPYEIMDIIGDKNLDTTQGPNLSWSTFLDLREDLHQVLEELHNQRDELLDQIRALQNELFKRGIPLPPVKGV